MYCNNKHHYLTLSLSIQSLSSFQRNKIDGCFKIYFWDGYSQSEVIEVNSERDAAKTIKRFLKKLVKILNR